MDNSMYYDGCKIQECFASKKMTRIPHPVYSPDMSPCDFWFFGCAKEQLKDQLKDQLITDDSNLEDRLTDIWEHVSRDIFQSVFFEWMERLGWVVEHEGDILSIHAN
jgi:hypothetical protein